MKRILLMFILLVPLVSAQLADSPWPMYMGGSKHLGQSSVDTSHVNGFVKWTFDTREGIESSPAIGEDGTIYVGSHDNKLYAINPDGSLKWSFYVGEPLYDDVFNVSKGILASPAVAKDGTVYFASLSDVFIALNPDGTEKWRYEVPITSDTWTSPVIGKDGTIYTGSARRKFEGSQEGEYYEKPISGIYAFNPDGTLKWRFISDSDMAGSIALGDETIYAFIGENADKRELDALSIKDQTWIGYLKAINLDGTERWKYPIIFSEASPTVTVDTIYMGTGHTRRGFAALDMAGNEKWFVPTVDDISSIAAVGKDGTVYVGVWDGMFYALNPDGTVKWEFKTPKKVEAVTASAAIGAEGTIYFGAADGMHALNPDGTEKWHYQKDISGIVSSAAIGLDGTVYVGSWNGKLYAFGEGPVSEDMSGPMYKMNNDPPTCPDGKWDEREQANPMLCPPDNPNLDGKEEWKVIYSEKRDKWKLEGIDCLKPSPEIEEKCDVYCYDTPEECPGYWDMKRNGSVRELNLLQRFFYWVNSLFK